MSIETLNFLIINNIKNELDISYLNKKKNILIQVFCGEGKNKLQNIINDINLYINHAICIGTTTDGEIQNSKVFTNKTVLSVSIFDNTSIKCFFSTNNNSYNNGKKIAKNLIQSNTKLLLLFTDGTTCNGEEFLKGVTAINNKIIVSGGMAGDNGQFNQTYISCGNNIFKNGAVGVSLNSDLLNVYNDYSFNWNPIGIGHTVNEVNKNRIYSIDNMTPVEFYTKYLGEIVSNALPATGIEFPLIIYKNDIQIARAVIAKHNDGSLSFAGNLEKGDIVRLGFGNAELIMSNSKNALKNFSNKNVETFFLYSCMARRRYMPGLIQIEIEPFLDFAPTAGFFTYGEFYHINNNNELLNQTLTVVALSESNENNKVSDNKSIKSLSKQNNEYATTIQALTHLIKQSIEDFETQAKNLEKEKLFSQDLLNKQKLFMNHAIHETITPLSVIMNNIELYEMDNGENVYLSNIQAAMKNVFNIYDDLSYLVKKDQFPCKKHYINIVDFIKKRIYFFEQVSNQSNIKIIFETSNDIIQIYFNEIKLQRIIDNNITNAIKYTKDNEDIKIIINKNINNLELYFASKSTHIQYPHKVFEAYYRESNKEEGYGLGLNLVKKICDEENIIIKLESNDFITKFTYTFKLDE